MPSPPTGPGGAAARATRWAPSVGPGVLMLAVALIGAGRPVLSWDEIATTDAARRTPGQIWHLIQHIDGVFGAYYFLIHFWTGIAGTGELALRLPSILAMAGAVALTGELGRRLFDPVTGAVAGVLLCLMPNTSRYAAEARPYAFACFFALLALLLLHRALDRPGWPRWTGYGLAVFALGLAHVIALTTLGAHVVVLARRKRLPVGWAISAGLALVALAPVFWLGVHERDAQLSWIAPLTLGGLWNFPGAMVGSAPGAWLLLGLALLALPRPTGPLITGVRRPAGALITGVRRLTGPLITGVRRPAGALITWVRGPDGPLTEVIAMAVAPIVAVAAVSVLLAPNWVARYLLIVLAPLALTAAVGLTRQPGRAGVRITALVALLALAVLPGQIAVRGATAKNGSDYRTAARIIESDRRPGDDIVYTAHSRTLRAGLDSYFRHYPGRPADLLLARDAAAVGSLRAQEYPDAAARVARATRVWLLVYGRHPDPTTARRELQPVLRTGFRRAGLWYVHRATLSLFVAAPEYRRSLR